MAPKFGFASANTASSQGLVSPRHTLRTETEVLRVYKLLTCARGFAIQNTVASLLRGSLDQFLLGESSIYADGIFGNDRIFSPDARVSFSWLISHKGRSGLRMEGCQHGLRVCQFSLSQRRVHPSEVCRKCAVRFEPICAVGSVNSGPLHSGNSGTPKDLQKG